MFYHWQKKHIQAGIFGLTLLLTGCTQSNEAPSNAGGSAASRASGDIVTIGDLQERFNQGRPAFDPDTDYSNDVSGNWTWFLVDDSGVGGMGGFSFVQNNNKIYGVNRVLHFGQPRTDELNEMAGVIQPILITDGRKNDKQISFKIMDHNGSVTTNTASLVNKGSKLMGQSSQVLPGGETVSYKWEAVRASG